MAHKDVACLDNALALGLLFIFIVITILPLFIFFVIKALIFETLALGTHLHGEQNKKRNKKRNEYVCHQTTMNAQN